MEGLNPETSLSYAWARKVEGRGARGKAPWNFFVLVQLGAAVVRE